MAFLVSLQAAYPVFYPKVSLTPIEDTWGVVTGDDHYVITSSLIEVRPPLFPLHGFTNHQDIHFGTKVRSANTDHTTPLMWVEVLDDNKTIRVHVTTDGWKYDVIGERIKYDYGQHINFILTRNITLLYKQRVENIDNKTVYYEEINAYNNEDYPISLLHIELFIENNTVAWKELYELAKNGKRFKIVLANEEWIPIRQGNIIRNGTTNNLLEFNDFKDGKIRFRFNVFDVMTPKSSQETFLVFIPDSP